MTLFENESVEYKSAFTGSEPSFSYPEKTIKEVVELKFAYLIEQTESEPFFAVVTKQEFYRSVKPWQESRDNLLQTPLIAGGGYKGGVWMHDPKHIETREPTDREKAKMYRDFGIVLNPFEGISNIIGSVYREINKRYREGTSKTYGIGFSDYFEPDGKIKAPKIGKQEKVHKKRHYGYTLINVDRIADIGDQLEQMPKNKMYKVHQFYHAYRQLKNRVNETYKTIDNMSDKLAYDQEMVDRLSSLSVIQRLGGDRG